jgi:hypothetical protein
VLEQLTEERKRTRDLERKMDSGDQRFVSERKHYESTIDDLKRKCAALTAQVNTAVVSLSCNISHEPTIIIINQNFTDENLDCHVCHVTDAACEFQASQSLTKQPQQEMLEATQEPDQPCKLAIFTGAAAETLQPPTRVRENAATVSSPC